MTERICKNCRFMRTGYPNPSFGICRAAPPQVVPPDTITWPPVRIADETIKTPDGQEILQSARDSYCFMFKPPWRWWEFWKFGGGEERPKGQVATNSPSSDNGSMA